MAAPTPVSALVHSSTLVTAGVYLLFRFNETLTNFSCVILSLMSTLTLIIASVRAMFEIDIKKIVALSTLSQLGLIVFAISIKFFYVGFFHLLTHAFFKALLFISVGNIIHLSDDFQDMRKIRLLPLKVKTTLVFIIITNLRLSGYPFFAGFYSKDYILELILTASNSLWVSFLFSLSLILTFTYSFRLMYLVLKRSIPVKSFTSNLDTNSYQKLAMSFLGPLAIIGGRAML